MASPGERARADGRSAALLAATLLLPQLLLFWPALVGRSILLPLDILALPGVYLPGRLGASDLPDLARSDLVYQMEPFRRLAVDEVRAGRLPLWSPYGYCGYPFLAANQSAVFSPFRLLDYLWPSPQALAWGQVLRAIVAGTGAFAFLRSALGLAPVAAALGAAAYPLSGFLILWAGHPHAAVAAWLPWVLLGVDRAARRPNGLGGVGLATATAAVLLSGHAGIGAQVLLGAGLFAIWRVWEERDRVGRWAPSLLATGAGFLAGVLLSAPQSLPTLEYMRSSRRLAARRAGQVETPAKGVGALPQMVLPLIHGSTQKGARYLIPGNLQESPAASYAGLVTTLVFAPLGMLAMRRRAALFWVALATLGAAQVLGLPLLGALLDSYPANLLRNNRLVLFTAWASVVLASAGIDALRTGRVGWRRGFWIPAALCAAGALYCGLRVILAPAPNPPLSPGAARWFLNMHIAGFATCTLAAGCWMAVRQGLFESKRWLVPAAAALALLEMTATAMGVTPEGDPVRYYPRLPALSALAELPAGRMCGWRCLPANLGQMYRLHDIRGYDGSDPPRIVDLLELFKDPSAPASPDYAAVQWLTPVSSPVADMLNLRYLVFRGSPPPGVTPRLQGPDYWVLENPHALPRAFVPRRVEVVNDDARRLALLRSPGFSPNDVAYVESERALGLGPTSGQASIIDETPNRLVVAATLAAPGLLVLSDSWDPGWSARAQERSIPVLRVNHALRGVVLPAGASLVEFRYRPLSFRLGLAAALAVLIALVVQVARAVREPRAVS